MVKPKKSIERRIMRSLIGYTLFTVALLWVFQIVFLNKYYHTMQKASILKAGSEIAMCISDEDFETKLEHICFSHGMCSVVIDGAGKEKCSIDMLGRGCLIHSPAKFSMGRLLSPVLLGDQEEMVVSLNDSHFRNEALIYARAVTDSKGERFVVILNASLDPVESTIGILKSQLGIITILLVAVALLVSKFVAGRLSRPLKDITQKAKRLAEGDYVADYEGGEVTEIDELAQALNFSAEGLSKVEDLRRELVANVSHDLKTPLTMIKAYAEMIRDLTGDDKKSRDEQLDVIISEADRLTALVTDLIRISREEESREYKKEAFDINQMVHAIAVRFAEVNGDYKIIEELPENAMVIADRDSIGQVLYNLISNAINYTGEDKAVKISAFETQGNMLRVEIKDSGRGIPAEEIPLIWERYYRSKNTHQRSVVGSGLGLSIVKGALTGQNLKFGVTSEINEGSCFWFELLQAEKTKEAVN